MLGLYFAAQGSHLDAHAVYAVFAAPGRLPWALWVLTWALGWLTWALGVVTWVGLGLIWAKSTTPGPKSTPSQAKSTPPGPKSTPSKPKSTPTRPKSTPSQAKSTPPRPKSTPIQPKSTYPKPKSTPSQHPQGPSQPPRGSNMQQILHMQHMRPNANPVQRNTTLEPECVQPVSPSHLEKHIPPSKNMSVLV